MDAIQPALRVCQIHLGRACRLDLSGCDLRDRGQPAFRILQPILEFSTVSII
ncbi:MAG TPA: hypothetical protein VFI35_14485 [Actinomycetota bacterium]|nr:hypothetical protein [Actinomycetota bacterium]